ncbi:MAG: aldehyde dehydrogenase family protein [Rhodococcus sp. (in: high G+C Gram-positive bacteria)]|nr:MAG: aldehyde dehydrogenase family protein [Rhodococcus sp. (in: high G+C Gram-positive bacteria)]
MSITSYAPRTGEPVESVPMTTPEELSDITGRSVRAAKMMRDTSPSERRQWLTALADALQGARQELVALADRETALGVTRLNGEFDKLVDQTRFYGDIAVEGSYLGVAIDDADGGNQSLVRINRPLGTVAVFGASNFPFVLGVLGHDTAAAIAAGCPVIVKAHTAHIGLSLRLAEIARDALIHAGAPVGVFDIVVGRGAGTALVGAPETSAVAFTGSQSGGLALWQAANERQVPIPVYAEMGTVNPIVVTRTAEEVFDDVAKGFVATFTQNGGQYCTKPGLMFAPAGWNAAERVADALRTSSPSPIMLTRAIADSVREGLDELRNAGARVVAEIADTEVGFSAPAAVLSVDIGALRPGSRFVEECFGPVAVVCEYASVDDLTAALAGLQGSLVAAVFTGTSDPDVPVVLTELEHKVGRVVVNGWTTGAPHSWAQQHGGPWPSTSNPAVTSIGAAALGRFVRPITFQGIDDEWLPPAARRNNPYSVSRRVNGVLEVPTTP